MGIPINVIFLNEFAGEYLPPEGNACLAIPHETGIKLICNSNRTVRLILDLTRPHVENSYSVSLRSAWIRLDLGNDHGVSELTRILTLAGYDATIERPLAWITEKSPAPNEDLV